MGVLAKQILPNIMAPIAVQITLDFARAIGVEAALSYLGLGLAAPYISWGLMVREAQDFPRGGALAGGLPGNRPGGGHPRLHSGRGQPAGPHGPAHAPGLDPTRTIVSCYGLVRRRETRVTVVVSMLAPREPDVRRSGGFQTRPCSGRSVGRYRRPAAHVDTCRAPMLVSCPANSHDNLRVFFRRRLRCSSSRGARHCSSSRLADDKKSSASYHAN